MVLLVVREELTLGLHVVCGTRRHARQLGSGLLPPVVMLSRGVVRGCSSNRSLYQYCGILNMVARYPPTRADCPRIVGFLSDCCRRMLSTLALGLVTCIGCTADIIGVVRYPPLTGLHGSAKDAGGRPQPLPAVPYPQEEPRHFPHPQARHAAVARSVRSAGADLIDQ